MKRSSGGIKKVRIKVTMRYHFKPSQMAKIRKMDITGIRKDVLQLEFSYTDDGNIKWPSHFESGLAVPQNVKQSCRITQFSAIRYASKRKENLFTHKNYTLMCIVVLFPIVKNLETT